MNAKENALRIMKFDHPERIVSEVPQFELAYFGCHHEGFDGGSDDAPVGARWTDVWGTGWEKMQDGMMGMPRLCPLDEPGKLRTYQWPDPDDERLCGRIYAMAERFPGGDLFLGASHRDTLWEKAYMLVGMENLLVYFYTEPEFVREILHRIMDFQFGMARHYLKLGVEFANLGDDLGTQRSLLMSPRIIQEFLVPEYRRLFDLYKEHGVLIGFHSCGNIVDALEIFMGLGANVLNPVQATANDLPKLREITQGRMALQGGVSSATIMAGPPEKIAAEVRERIGQLGREGGYFCGPDQGMPYPPEHLAAFAEALERYGRYPLPD